MPKLPTIDSLTKKLVLIGAIITVITAIFGGYYYVEEFASNINYPEKLTSDKLHSIEDDLLREAFVVKQPLSFKDKLSDGSHLYQGVVTRGSVTSTFNLYVYKDESKAHTQFLNQVSELKSMGYNGSYVNSYAWEGSKLKYDTIITGDVAEGNNPYSVAVIYVTGTAAGQ